MRSSRRLTFLVLSALSLMTMGLLGGVASAAPGPNAKGQDRDAVIAYWTPERVATAIPRNMVREGGPATPAAKPDGNPGNGNGKGGGGDDGGSNEGTVTGEPWPSNGSLVEQTTGKVLFTMGSSNYVCSGSVVDDSDDGAQNGVSLVVTAGHCLYDEVNKEFATNFMFVPNYEDGGTFTGCDTSPGCWVADRLATSSKWASGASDKWNGDWGFAVFSAIDGQTLEQAVGGEQSIAFVSSVESSGTIDAFGYPAAKKYDGTDLIYCEGPDQADPAGLTTRGIQCDMTGGSSGGPWFEDFDGEAGTITSVTSYSYRSLKNVLFGPIFNSATQTTYQAALTSGGNVVQ